MMSGDLKASYMMDRPPEGPRSLGNGRHSPTSPLKLFGEARKKINDIFIEIGNYTEETNSFLKDSEVSCTIVEASHLEQVEDYAVKVCKIREMLSRDRMKVVFFGRTSNGKSTVINAMLKHKILPSGIGHTTHCFIQVEGVDGTESYIMQEGLEQPLNIQSIGQLANALSSAKLEQNTLIRICWPKDKCSLLRDDVIIVDSPGIDVSPDLDSWIDNHCLDADVFVLVANAESTIMQTEKNFFHKVSLKLSKPNIFVLNNRWDASATEPETMAEVRDQHMERITKFMTEELKVIHKHEVKDRVFFVSAREALIDRVHQERGAVTPTDTFLEGFQSRLFEFRNFERKFEECISKSAVQTKFAQHTDNGKHITNDIRVIMDEVCELATKSRKESQQKHQEVVDKFDFTEKQLRLLTDEIKQKIVHMTEEVEKKVSSAIMEEIRRLSILVDEFERPFHPDPMLLNVYKKELHAHVEASLGRNLQHRCSAALQGAVETSRNEMTERLSALLPEETKQQAINVVPNKDFEVAYRLDCRNLCGDFQEDIEFRFSLGLTSLMRRFLGPQGTQKTLLHHAGYADHVPRPMAMTPQTPSNEGKAVPQAEHEILLAMIGTFSSLYSRSTVGALAITGLVAKAAGWKIIAVCGAVYGILYVYERLTWTNKNKERVFKRQYVNHATHKLRLIVDLTSSNCGDQVQRELKSTLHSLSHQVDQTKGELKEEMERLANDIKQLDQVATRSNFLRNKANYLDTELNTFIHKFLNKPDSNL